MEKRYVHYGCGLSAPIEWSNFDASPTLRLQRLPLIGTLFKKQFNVIFPKEVQYGDIVKGLPLKDNSCSAIYCSHVLEHLSLKDFRIAFVNTYSLLEPGGLFRCIVPDLEVIVNYYIEALRTRQEAASIDFIGDGILMGLESRPKGMKGLITSYFGNSRHLWMWDHFSMRAELTKVGFKDIRRARFNDSLEAKFKLVESESRFENAVAFECSK
jgi:SAM-dependent methyltransferase